MRCTTGISLPAGSALEARGERLIRTEEVGRQEQQRARIDRIRLLRRLTADRDVALRGAFDHDRVNRLRLPAHEAVECELDRFPFCGVADLQPACDRVERRRKASRTDDIPA